jgi:hypothetical protein
MGKEHEKCSLTSSLPAHCPECRAVSLPPAPLAQLLRLDREHKRLIQNVAQRLFAFYTSSRS